MCRDYFVDYRRGVVKCVLLVIVIKLVVILVVPRRLLEFGFRRVEF